MLPAATDVYPVSVQVALPPVWVMVVCAWAAADTPSRPATTRSNPAARRRTAARDPDVPAGRRDARSLECRRTRPRRAGRMQAAGANGRLSVGLRCAEASRRAAQSVVGPTRPVCSKLASHPPFRRAHAQSPRRFQRARATSARRVRAIQTVTSPAASRRLTGCRNPWTGLADPVRSPGRRDCYWRHLLHSAWSWRAGFQRATFPSVPGRMPHSATARGAHGPEDPRPSRGAARRTIPAPRSVDRPVAAPTLRSACSRSAAVLLAITGIIASKNARSVSTEREAARC